MTQHNFASGGLKPVFAWYRYDTACVIKRLHSNETGLSTEEALLRLTALDGNQLCTDKDKSAMRCLLSHCNNVLIYALLAAAVLGTYQDTGLQRQSLAMSLFSKY